MKFSLPKSVLEFINGEDISRDKIGESPAKVYKIKKKSDLFFLKISEKKYSPTTFSVTREARTLEWLQGRANVPELVLHAENAKWECLITRSVPGLPLYTFIKNPGLVVDAFCDAIRCLQRIPIEDCPYQSNIKIRLTELDYLLKNNLVATDVDLSGYANIESESDLVDYLKSTSISEDIVFSHGDLGDSNIFLDERANLHFIDLGRSGLADAWVDISLAHRNLREEISTAPAETFLKKLGLLDQPVKRRYFEALDELF